MVTPGEPAVAVPAPAQQDTRSRDALRSRER
jgi:hypothetical protein